MKKNYILLILITVSYFAKSQAYYKNALIFDANAGIEIYNTSYSYELKNSNNKIFDTTTTDKAGNYNFTLVSDKTN